MTDGRSSVYRGLHARHAKDDVARAHSAEQVLRTLFASFKPGSLLDVGCGVGFWLAAAERLGVGDVLGVEGPWAEDVALRVDQDKLVIHDLESGFDLGRRFDLAASIEVAEHLSPAAAGPFVQSLVRHSDLVLFSAAIPGQGGTGHLNEQFPHYWADHFAAHGYRPVDVVRRALWTDRSVHVWLRQNVIPFASPRFLAEHAWAREAADANGPLSIVHPELFDAYRARVGAAL